jgi:hypothetical protein
MMVLEKVLQVLLLAALLVLAPLAVVMAGLLAQDPEKVLVLGLLGWLAARQVQRARQGLE